MWAFKNGRTTGPTAGQIHCVEPSVQIGYKDILGPDGRIYAVQGKAIVTIRPNGWKTWAEKGDSGSLVIDHMARDVGILVAVTLDSRTAYVAPSAAVLKDMKGTLTQAGFRVKEVAII